MDVQELMAAFDNHHVEVRAALETARRTDAELDQRLSAFERSQTELKAAITAAAENDTDLKSRLADVEQRLARRGGPAGPAAPRSWGQEVIESPRLKSFIAENERGRCRVEVKGTPRLDLKAILGLGNIVAPDYRPELIALAQRALVIRDLLAPGSTTSNVVDFVRQSSFTNAAAPVAEGSAKPYSDTAFTLVSTPVRTVAHLMKSSRQALDDLPVLQSFVDEEMRYGLGYVEDVQLLTGDGTGQNLTGLIPAATAYSAPFTVTGETAWDTILLGAAQLATASVMPTGVIVHPIDWFKMLATKDGMGRYLASDGPMEVAQPQAWSLPVAVSLAMPAGHYLIGNFRMAAQIFDRLNPEVLISTENADDFEKNLITVRAEERLALAIKRPWCMVYGTFP